jgi:hypothetical protein
MYKLLRRLKVAILELPILLADSPELAIFKRNRPLFYWNRPIFSTLCTLD